MARVLGVDVGGTHTRWGVIQDDNVLYVNKTKSQEIVDFVLFIKSILDDEQDIEQVCMGVPGIVNQHHIVNIPNLSVLNIPDLADQIQAKTGVKTSIYRDVQLLFAHDQATLGIQSKKNILAFYLGTGIGNVIKVNGNVLEGMHGFASELGHIPIHGSKEICPCGKTGCAEITYSGKGLVALFEQHHLSGKFQDVFLNHFNHQAIQDYLKGFAEVIGIEMNILDITEIIIGGGVANMVGFPRDILIGFIEKHLRKPLTLQDLHVYFVDDSPKNSIIGAGLILKEEV